jgi:predicted nuclease of predicted toxin-antitoxin system
MKLLLDQNLSFKLCDTLKSIFPEIIHVNKLGLQKENDDNLWKFAKNNSFIIVTKDSDFSEKAIVKGFPPKTIWIKKGNCSTKEIEKILRNKFLEIKSFSEDNINSILILT